MVSLAYMIMEHLAVRMPMILEPMALETLIWEPIIWEVGRGK